MELCYLCCITHPYLKSFDQKIYINEKTFRDRGSGFVVEWEW